MDVITAIILAAGRGTRINSIDKNKVAMEVKGEAMITRTINILKESGIKKIIVVVGFAKESVIRILDDSIIIAEQNDQLGTGHAVSCALIKIPSLTEDLLIINGDDSFLYTPETLIKLYQTHENNNAKITLITMQSQNPTGFGRIVRNKDNEVVSIVEEKNATKSQKEIKEINLGCYIVDSKYLQQNIDQIKKNPITGEYYITDIIDIISSHNDKIAAYKLVGELWHGVNTRDDLIRAESIMNNE